MADQYAKALALAKQIDARADRIARYVELEIRGNCGGRPEFMVILLRAVAMKIEKMATEAEQEPPR